jgi:uncharacterized NAD(P)/FAD-binding protein YdhS
MEKSYGYPEDKDGGCLPHNINICIIGCGAGAVVFLRHLIEDAIREKLSNLNITIFEPAKDFGVGLAYQFDLDTLLLNKPSKTMAAHATQLNEFHLWLQNHPGFSKYEFHESIGEGIDRSYTSRRVFGLYLKDTLNSLIEESQKHGIEIRLVHSEVTDIHSLSPFSIEAIGEDPCFADFLILSVGNNQPRDVYRLGNTPRYINNPYPLINQLPSIKKDHSVGIIGTSLTAVDIAISLKELKHIGPITLMSRTNFPIRARGPLIPTPPKFLTMDLLHQIQKKKKALTLWETIRILRKEFKEIECDWRFLFRETDSRLDFKTFLKRELGEAQTERKWQGLLYGLHEVAELWWHCLDRESKAIFLSRFNRAWMTNWTPIPLTNIKRIIKMTEEKQLYYKVKLISLTYKSDEDKYIAHFNSEESVKFDWIINATGPSRFVEPADPLLFELIDKGFIKENAFGGIEVDFDTSAVIDAKRNINSHMRLLGHNSAGTYFYMSCLEMISLRAKKVAKDLIRTILYDSDKAKNKNII